MIVDVHAHYHPRAYHEALAECLALEAAVGSPPAANR